MLALLYSRPDGSFVALVNGLPYHVRPSDEALYELALLAVEAGGMPPEEPVPDPAPAPQITRLTFAQLLIGLVTEGWITEAEGDAWLVGTLPAPVQDFIAGLSAEQQFTAKAKAARFGTADIDDPMVQALAAAQDKTDDLPAFFNAYGAL